MRHPELALGEKRTTAAARSRHERHNRASPAGADARMITLYDYLDSGNGYKIRLALAQLEQPYRWVELDIMTGDAHAGVSREEPERPYPDARARRWHLPGRVQRHPVVSRRRHGFVPEERAARAQVLQWMFFEQYSHEPYVATPRFIIRHLARIRRDAPNSPSGWTGAGAGRHGSAPGTNRFFVAERYTIADIALYAYTHVAPEGGLDSRRIARCAPGLPARRAARTRADLSSAARVIGA